MLGALYTALPQTLGEVCKQQGLPQFVCGVHSLEMIAVVSQFRHVDSTVLGRKLL